MKKTFLKRIVSIASAFLIFSICGYANAVEETTDEDNTVIISKDEHYIWFHGRDEGFEPEMGHQTNALVTVGENDEYLFSLSYDYNSHPSRTNGFKQSGLYMNNEEKTLVYEIPNPEFESTAEISRDGREVWIRTDSWLPFSIDRADMSYPVIKKYIDGEEVFTVRLSDIFSSPNRLEDGGSNGGTYWCYFESSDPERIVLRTSKNDKKVIVYRTSEKVNAGLIDNGKILNYLLAAFSAVIVAIAVCCLFKRSKANKKEE